MSNGKGSRPRMVPKIFRAGYEQINWAKKPAPNSPPKVTKSRKAP